MPPPLPSAGSKAGTDLTGKIKDLEFGVWQAECRGFCCYEWMNLLYLYREIRQKKQAMILITPGFLSFHFRRLSIQKIHNVTAHRHTHFRYGFWCEALAAGMEKGAGPEAYVRDFARDSYASWLVWNEHLERND